MSVGETVPNVPSVEQAAKWMREVFRANSEFGPKLHATFRRPACPPPDAGRWAFMGEETVLRCRQSIRAICRHSSN